MLELLAPAGSPEAVTAAVQAGADAVYLGYGDFNARRNAKNFSLEELAAAVSYCHVRGAKVFLTLNTLVSDRELPAAARTAAEAAEADFDLKFKEHGFPADAPVFAPDLTPDENGLVYVAKILVDAGVAGTASEARRLIDGGGVKVNGEALAPKAYNVAPEVLAGAEVQVGKKKFVRFE